jgi:hypothetical protein
VMAGKLVVPTHQPKESGECLIPLSSEIKTEEDSQRMLSSHSWSLVEAKPYAGGGVLVSWSCAKCKARRMSIIVPEG